jgi:hypothetical protein
MNPTSSRSIALLLLCAALVACGSSSSTDATDAPVVPGDDSDADAGATPPPPPPPAADAGHHDASPDADAGHDSGPPVCSIVGTWSGAITCIGTIGFTFTARADGTATESFTGGATHQDTYTFVADTLAVTETDDPSCTTAGKYKLVFDATCGQFTYAYVDDACTLRRSCMNGITMKKQ